MTRITLLIDNLPSKDNSLLKAEHGLSLYIENGNTRVLCDTGLSGTFMNNATGMGIDLSACDFVFISHGHNDHTGGLERFLQGFEKIQVFMHGNIAKERYYSSRREEKRDISCTCPFIGNHMGRITFLKESREIAEGIYAIGNVNGIHPKPVGNRFLTAMNDGKEYPDNFVHEMSLALTTERGLIVISPCSHCGALNIMEEAMRTTGCNKIAAYIGGLHFVEGDGCREEALEFARYFTQHHPGTVIYTGHCTCDTAKEVLAANIKNIGFFSTGTILEI